MKARLPSGCAVILMETDFSEVKTFNEESLSNVLKQYYSQLSQREKIRARYGTVVSDFSERKIYKYNTENYKPPKEALDRFARAILRDIREYFSKEENRKAYEEEKIINRQ